MERWMLFDVSDLDHHKSEMDASMYHGRCDLVSGHVASSGVVRVQPECSLSALLSASTAVPSAV